jgi:large subunit ribosomal protein L30
MTKIAITWKKSGIGFARNQRRVISSLGLRRLNQTVEHEDTPSIMGMVDKVRHLLEVKEMSGSDSD